MKMTLFYLAIAWPGLFELMAFGNIDHAFIGLACLVGTIGVVSESVAFWFRRLTHRLLPNAGH